MTDPDKDRQWNADLQEWVWPQEIEDALAFVTLLVDEYYNGDREWAVAQMVRAHQAAKKLGKDAES